ncbi:transcriptional Regulator, Crp/Fnr family, putative [Microscilla marina ATCC 23134]|uniref:Transcriptional Regulator, Crp/Fnr family, putative n=2 Tax=Microscilla marina TaxID=1027 RepID=A1ZR18_MICM2|nr:transcriptional Regulator, Crp/Fnr family, putative [Microscilla marina ATCC 23134]
MVLKRPVGALAPQYSLKYFMKIDVEKFNFQSDKILSSLSPEERKMFLSVAYPLTFKKGKLVFYEEGIPTGVFIIESGRAKIFKTGLDGKDQIFYIYKQGDLLGYHALLCNEKYADSCEALEDCQMLFINQRKFEQLLTQIPHLQALLIQNMSHEFGVMVNTITVLAQKPLRERLALFLLLLEQKYSETTGKPGKIVLPREDLANIVGTARESLGRLLKEFREEKLILIENKAITLINPTRLHQMANAQYT